MEGDAAIQAIYGPELTALKEAGKPIPPDLDERIGKPGRIMIAGWMQSMRRLGATAMQ